MSSFLGSLFKIGASALGGAGGLAGSSAMTASAEALRQASSQILESSDDYVRTVRQEGRKLTKAAQRQMSRIKPIQQYSDLPFIAAEAADAQMAKALGMTQEAFDAMSAQKRSNLDFSIGGAMGGLRQAQIDFAALAAGDTSAFNDIVAASAYGELAQNAGMPMGAFANTSARNMLELRMAGVEGAMGITDFFAEQGTVDPLNPIDTAFDLALFDQAEATREDDLNRYNRNLRFELDQYNRNLQLNKSQVRLGTRSSVFSTLAAAENARLNANIEAYKLAAGVGGTEQLAASNAMGSLGQTLAQIGTTLSSGRSGAVGTPSVTVGPPATSIFRN